MKYKYQAKTKEGETQVGYVEAGSRESAVDILAGHDLFILKIESTETNSVFDRLSSYFAGVKRQDMVIFSRQLSTLLEARLSLNKALATLVDQTENPTLKEAIIQIGQDIDSGISFSQSLERQSEIFSGFFVSMIRSAEVTGNLDQVSKFLADYIEREAVLVNKARSAMIYPAIIIGLFALVAVIMVTVVFPQIAPIFEQSGVELPILSKIFLGAGAFVGDYWIALLIVVAIIGVMLLDYFQTQEGHALLDDMKVKMPVVKSIFLPITITRFANAAAMLLKGGVPVAQAMEIVGETVDNVLYQDLFREISEGVRQGLPLSQAIASHPDYFPPLVSQMLAVGEATGQIDEIFIRIGNFYGRESDGVVNNLVELIQPVLMIGIGLMVGLLFAAILLPLYQLTSTFQ